MVETIQPHDRKIVFEFMNKSLILIAMLVALFAGCKPVEVDFSYSPKEPCAGQPITFTNLSTAGESWLWNFGDNSTNLAKNPKHIYNKPGTYVVTLMVDSAKYKTCAKEITVYDTIPTFVCSTDSVLHYQDLIFEANVHNPFNHPISYEWITTDNCHILSNSTNGKKLSVYYKLPADKDSVTLVLTLDEKEYRITKTFTVHLTQAPAIVMKQNDGTIVRQRMIKDRIEEVRPGLAEDYALLAATNDTMVNFNGKQFTASQLDEDIAGFVGMTILHMQLDAMAQKWYIHTTEGLWVANFDGSNLVLIDSAATGALYVDANRNRLYWATPTGLSCMPLVKSKNNQFTSKATQYNTLNDIVLIAVDNNLR